MSRDYDNYHADVVYDVWMRGGNVDAIDDDRVRDRYYDGCEADEAAVYEYRRQRRLREERSKEDDYEAF